MLLQVLLVRLKLLLPVVQVLLLLQDVLLLDLSVHALQLAATLVVAAVQLLCLRHQAQPKTLQASHQQLRMLCAVLREGQSLLLDYARVAVLVVVLAQASQQSMQQQGVRAEQLLQGQLTLIQPGQRLDWAAVQCWRQQGLERELDAS
jgi:hypothetical protein